MNLKELSQWQWDGYSKNHTSVINLIIHVVAVPVFILGVISLLINILFFSWSALLISVLTLISSIVAQAIGHKNEEVPPESPSSVFNLIKRLLVEQFVNFPRFFISGRWFVALKNALKT